MGQRLDEVIQQFESARRAQGLRPNTVRNERRCLDRLLAHLGPIQVRSIEEHHIDSYLAACQAKGYTAGSLNVELQSLRNFFGYCTRRGYTKINVAAHRRGYRSIPRKRLRIPAHDFPRLLDAAKHPRDRMLVALGLYLWVRDSEVTELRVGDVDLQAGEITVRIQKTNEIDLMPISLELDRELRRWLRFYSEDLGAPLERDMRLVPAKSKPRVRHERKGHYVSVYGQQHLRPYAKMTRTQDTIQNVLVACGYDIRQENGKSAGEGMHTLRRSGARARFDYLVSQGYDGAIREVQSQLHHKNVQTTERYIGLDLDTRRRNMNVRGNLMYGEPILANVVDLMEVRSGS